METNIIYVTVGHYGKYDDACDEVEYVGTDKGNAFQVIKTLDYSSSAGFPFASAHVEVWKNETQICTHNSDGEIMWELKSNQSIK